MFTVDDVVVYCMIVAGIWKYTHGASTWKTYFDWTFVFGFQDMPWKDRAQQEQNPMEAVPYVSND